MPDIIVIGGGSGGTAAATRAAQLGAQVTVIERAHLGGMCVNNNCIPMSSLLASVELYRNISQAADLGIQVGPPSFNVPGMIAHRDRVVQDLREGIAGLLPTFGIEIIEGQARLVDDKTVEVNGLRLQATRAIILATGAQWAPLPPGVEDVMRPDEAIQIDPVPDSLLIWGGGVPDIEFATLYAALGSKVTLAVDGPYPLPLEDYEIGQRLQGILQNQGIQVINDVRLKSVTRNGGVDVTLTGLKGDTLVTVDKFLWAGRVPAIDRLELDKAGVKLNDGAVVADDRMQTNVPGVYALGDLTGGTMYSSLATVGGLVAAENAMGFNRILDQRAVPRYAFSLPEVATVGLTEDEAIDQGYDVEIANIVYGSNPRAMSLNEVEGGIKFVADRKLGKVLGVHIVGYRATELIAEATLGIQLEALAEDFAWAIRIHPTLSESLVEAGRAISGQALYIPKF
jgi:dihydrolipoamide dehydrogenase